MISANDERCRRRPPAGGLPPLALPLPSAAAAASSSSSSSSSSETVFACSATASSIDVFTRATSQEKMPQKIAVARASRASSASAGFSGIE